MIEIFMFNYKIYIKDTEAFLERNKRYTDLSKIPELVFSSSDYMFKVVANKATMQAVRQIYGEEAKYDQSFLDFEKKALESTNILVEKKDVELCDTKLYAYQEKIFTWVKQRKKIALFMDMGTGKTLVTLNFIMYYRPKKILIICPKIAMYVWQSEFKKHIKNNPYQIITLDKGTSSSKAEKVKDLKRENTVIIINYESCWRDHIEKALKDYKADMIICDESHKVKTYGSNVSKYVRQLGKNTEYKAILTGTPVTNTKLDYWGQFAFLDITLFGHLYSAFKNRYFEFHPKFPSKIIKEKNMDELLAKVSENSVTVKLKEVKTDLPAITEEIIYTEMSSAQQKAYDKLRKEQFLKLEKGEILLKNAMNEMQKLQQISSGFIYIENEATYKFFENSKIEALIELIESMGEEKVIVFCSFTEELKMIKTALEKEGKATAVIGNGQNELQKFYEGAQICIINLLAGAEGIDLTSAHYAIYFSPTIKMDKFEQSRARIYRNGQTMPCFVYHLINKNTVDTKIYSALKNKIRNKDLFEKGIKMYSEGDEAYKILLSASEMEKIEEE
ncbi:MAG TPA: DEAD/DEAH box helicase [Petrotogaceae bacterium]|nr:DEAD/DEAH box helicase [Petrotogaceae bacterium]